MKIYTQYSDWQENSGYTDLFSRCKSENRTTGENMNISPVSSENKTMKEETAANS